MILLSINICFPKVYIIVGDKMKLQKEIKLENPDYCNGCPCLTIIEDKNDFNPIFHRYENAFKCQYYNEILGNERPEKCIKENGE